MERFPARAFYQVGRLLATVRCSHAHAQPKGDALLVRPLEQHAGDPKSLGDFVGQVAERCHNAGLEYSFLAAQRFVQRIATGPLTNRQVIEEIDKLDERIRDEIASRLFFSVPPAKATYFLEPDPAQATTANSASLRDQRERLFGKDVQDRFPSTLFDFQEAATLLAFGRGTACVMHLVRVVETGLTTLAIKELKLPARNNWGKHLSDIESELSKRYRAAGARTPEEIFYSDAAAQIGHIKTAWRNPTMHVDRRYTEGEAGEVFMAVRSLMQHLATKLRE